MILCPVAIAVGCKKCPVFRVCPVKGIIGDYQEDTTDQTSTEKKVTASKATQKK
jgi:hypothetical protein